jgi:hypothetical protein
MQNWLPIFCALSLACADAAGEIASRPSSETEFARLAAVEEDGREPFSEHLGRVVPAGFDSSFEHPKSSLLGELAWQKGGLRIVPYGAFWADMVYASERTNPGEYTLFVFSRQQHGEDAFTIDARRTRLGAKSGSTGRRRCIATLASASTIPTTTTACLAAPTINSSSPTWSTT